MNNLVSGSSKELGLHSQTVQSIAEEYSTRRKQFKTLLRWRGKKSLGWIPFKALGIKTLATCSDGEKVERPNLRKAALIKRRRLKKCQHYAQKKQSKSKKYFPLPKLKQEKNLHAKIAHIKQDYLHKESTKLAKKYSLIVVGDVPCKLMNRSKTLAGISLDSGIGMFKNMLKYKAVRAASTYSEFSERNSTLTCSNCRLNFAANKILV